MRTTAFLLVTIGLASTAEAEPTFLAKQYTRCTACHYSPTGGGLLTPYGRLLSHRELSTSGGAASSAPDATDDLHGEPAFLFGALGNVLGPVHLGLELRPAHLGLELRPAHLGIGFPGGHQDIDFLMNADLVGALQNNGWTAYATIGREPPNSAVRNGRTQPTAAFISYEHWISYQTDKGVTIRAGRFMPAYGVAFADHTAYTRIGLDHDRNQVYGLEVSDTIGPSLVQVMVGPGKAEAILHDSSRRGFSTAGRWQFDFSSHATIVGSPSIAARQRWIRSQAQEESPSASRLLLTCRSGRKSDTDLETKAAGGRSYVVVNETSIGVYRGLWLKFSPQLRTSGEGPGFFDLAASPSRRTCCRAPIGT